MQSIRRNLTVRLVVTLTLLIGVGGITVYGTLRTLLQRDEEQTLTSKARALQALVHLERTGDLELEFAKTFIKEFEPGHNAEYFELWRDGEVLSRSPSLKGDDLPRSGIKVNESQIFGLRLPDGRRGRAIEIRFNPVPDTEEYENAGQLVPPLDPNVRVTLVLARGREELERVLDLLELTFAAICVLFPIGIMLVVRLVVNRAMRPVADVATAAAGISAQNLDYRFASEVMPIELQPIGDRLNNLLGRLEEAFKRQRRFNGDVAHELRTPIAELRTMAEVALMDPDDPEIAHQTLEESLEVTGRMSRLINTLLVLARTESGHQRVELQSVELGALLREGWAPFAERAQDRGLAIAWRIADGALWGLADPTMLRAVVENLFSNAIAHTTPGGTILVEAARAASAADARVRVRIANPAGKLVAADLPQIFEPFWQKDSARSDEEHSGLGLALVSALCRIQQIRVGPELSPAGEFAMVLEIPAAEAPAIAEARA